ncbi:MAG: hypothetical protein Q7J24_10755, partial [Desulfomicrobium sp.]|nr:hypothetical protein [Desulfomicrobium sp.]
VAHKTLIQVLFTPTRYLFVKDPLAFRQEESSLSTQFPTVKRFLKALFQFNLRKCIRKGQRLSSPALPLRSAERGFYVGGHQLSTEI